MKKKYNFILITIFTFFTITLFYQCKSSNSDNIVFIENGKIKLGFEKKTGKFLVFNDLITGYEFIDQTLVRKLPWEINTQSSADNSSTVKEFSPAKFSFSKVDPFTLILKWEKFENMNNLNVKAEISLDKNDSFSYWNISVNGFDNAIISNVVFPRIEGIKDMENEELVIPTWMGSLMKDPRAVLSGGNGRMEWRYPGSLSSQVIAVYNADKNGFYASCNDSLSYAKNFSLNLDTLNTLVYEMINYPSSSNPKSDTYTPNYKGVIGSFEGDWIDVANIYSKFALNQKWAKESRFKNGLTPSWLEKTALWVWNRGKSANVLEPAIELKQALGLPVNVLWHWWHNCSYDDNFPEYLPPREGKQPFIHAVRSAQDAGVNSIVYMNAIQWGEATEGWKSGEVKPYTVKDINGNERSHVFNIFSGKALINMCIGTKFWRDHYSSLCDSVVNIYETNGVYMDQTCLSVMCYDKSHNHDIGGGNYWVENSGKLINQIRSKDFGVKKPIFTGEGSSENWLPHLDAFLTLQASKERYAGIGNTETIPFFQAVFHQYGITFGSYSSLVTPPYDELWPKKYAPSNTEQPLDEMFNKQFLMEQAKSFVWGMQPTIANYHSFLASERREEIDYLTEIVKTRYNALDYLLYGEFCRNPDLKIPRENIKISKLSIYAGKTEESVTTFEKNVPSLYVGTWKAKNGNIAVALASISDEVIPVDFTIDPEKYNISAEGDVNIIKASGKMHLETYLNNIHIEMKLNPKDITIIEIVPQ
ncbi:MULTISPECIES: DUF6259 domain-containing protein [Proteiniphilum]|jgi:hypothetical protein|uniref:DUF6259 domain-containing protein n=1 Tax=Proteiniphilum TaxID=294702 RepID=UPI001EEB07CB|nr:MULTISPECIES: DUF6259 domain-containing protein [Proteiniphilum]ULB34618.1 hypothetical protein KDN43_00710 [Proteiniphilum propionicum]